MELSPEELAAGIASLLDTYRRNRLLHDIGAPIFSRYWREGDDEVQRGFLPFFDFPPKGMKAYREAGDREIYVMQFRSRKGQTLTQNYVNKWDIQPTMFDQFLEALWPFLTDTLKVLEPVTLIGARGALPGATGVYQVAAARCGLVAQHERYRCTVCQRIHTRIGPKGACTAMHCKGTLEREEPPVDDYNITMLDLPFSMLTAQEHSAQVPPKERETIEDEFKKPEGKYNCLGLADRAAAVNLGEALRIGATQLLEMETQDLQLLPLPQSDDSYHLFLYDPMPGGSGLLHQLLEQWESILAAATQNLSTCENKCQRSCYNCMRTYRNIFYHDLLDRHEAVKLLKEYQSTPKQERELTPVEEAVTSSSTGEPTNRGEEALAEMLVQAGLPQFEHQRRIELGKPFGATVPDLFFEDPVSGVQLVVYLDGLSKGIHGNMERHQMDRMIRERLEEEGMDVIEIASSDLDDPEVMKRHLKRISVKLRRR